MDASKEKSKGLNIKIWKKFFVYAKRYKMFYFGTFASTITMSAVDLTIYLLTAFAIDRFVTGRDISALPIFIPAFVAAVTVRGLVVFFYNYFRGKATNSVLRDIREDCFKKLQELSFSYYDNKAVGSIMARAMSDSRAIAGTFTWLLSSIVWSGSMAVIALGYMFVTDAFLAAITLLIVPVFMFPIRMLGRKMLKVNRVARELNASMTGVLNEGITGAKTIKTLNREEKSISDFEAISSDLRHSNIKAETVSAFLQPLGWSVGNVSLALVLSIGGYSVMSHMGGGRGITLGMLTVFIFCTRELFDSISQIVDSLTSIQATQASAEMTFDLLDAVPDIIDEAEAKDIDTGLVKGAIEFRNVSFTYNTGERVLQNFNLTVKPGDKVALVGKTGAGKSTIVNLMCRFYEPTSGDIFIDNINYKTRTQNWLHSNIGYVLQAPHLFSGSIRENIRYGKLTATDVEIENAARTVNAYDFIMKLEKGFDTDVGEGGNRLSSGERQLISFARAIIRNPSIFVLDEATSSIDTETEQVIQEALQSTLSARTSFFIAHRLSTTRFCDNILVIESGEIIEQGTHKQLLKQKGHYYELYTNQIREEAESRLLQA